MLAGGAAGVEGALMRGRMLAFAVAFGLAGAAHAETPLSRNALGQPTAPVRVGAGVPAPFVIDTGAEGCAVHAGFAAARRLAPVGPEAPARVRAPVLTLDGRHLGAIDCTVLPDNPEDGATAGVLGAAALARFVVVLDAERGTLSLHGGAQRGQALVGPRARLVEAVALPGGPLAVPVRLNSARGLGVLRTGSAGSAVNTRFAEAAGLAPANRTSEMNGHMPVALDLAGAVTPDGAAPVADLPEFATLGLAERPAMTLGLDRLAGLRLVIDYPRRRIWFDPG